MINTYNWDITTYTGKHFSYYNPRFDIIDIAHSLSNLCRFAGHVTKFYSVAEHSLNVANHLPKDLFLTGLLHDASEAYMVDIPKPLKKYLPQYKEMEYYLQIKLSEFFDLPWPWSEEVYKVDWMMTITEAKNLMLDRGDIWTDDEPFFDDVDFKCWSPKEAEEQFLIYYRSIAE